jgi:hypothetical protein
MASIPGAPVPRGTNATGVGGFVLLAVLLGAFSR